MNSTVRIERAKKRISQEELAVATRVSQHNIHLIENNLMIPKLSMAKKIASFFNLRVDEIFQVD